MEKNKLFAKIPFEGLQHFREVYKEQPRYTQSIEIVRYIVTSTGQLAISREQYAELGRFMGMGVGVIKSNWAKLQKLKVLIPIKVRAPHSMYLVNPHFIWAHPSSLYRPVLTRLKPVLEDTISKDEAAILIRIEEGNIQRRHAEYLAKVELRSKRSKRNASISEERRKPSQALLDHWEEQERKAQFERDAELAAEQGTQSDAVH